MLNKFSMHRNNKVILIAMLVILSTYDSIVIPYLRISIADISLLSIIFFLGLTYKGLKKSVYFVTIVLPIFLLINAIIYILFILMHNKNLEIAVFVSGFLRPAMFIVIAINIYYGLKSINLKNEDLYKSICIGSILLSLVVILQYFGIWPAQYHNNPSFGESSRWTNFSEGWRPTGLSNEASFTGIFLVLLLSFQLYIKQKLNRKEIFIYKYSSLFTLIGCFCTTSRLSLIIGLFIFAVQSNYMVKLVIALTIMLIILFYDIELLSRITNLLTFDGDASTIERYGSFLAYYKAIASGDYLMGTGYLNSSDVVLEFADPLVSEVLNNRTLPAFSLPLQLIFELGIPLIFFLSVFCLWKLRNFMSSPLLALVICSLFTGIQNFVFVYVFMALLIHAKNSFRK